VYLRHLTGKHIEQLNTFSVAFGLITCAICCALATPVAVFFKSPHLRSVILVMSAAFVISSFQVVAVRAPPARPGVQVVGVADGCRALAAGGDNGHARRSWLANWSLVYGGLVGSSLSAAVPGLATTDRVQQTAAAFRIQPALVFSRDVIVSRVSWYAYANSDFTVAGRVLWPGAARCVCGGVEPCEHRDRPPH